MEYVLVRTDDGADRPVWIDDRPSGRTNLVLEVQRGTHTFALCACPEEDHDPDCPAAGCRPVQQTLDVSGTFRIRPLEVDFACS